LVAIQSVREIFCRIMRRRLSRSLFDCRHRRERIVYRYVMRMGTTKALPSDRRMASSHRCDDIHRCICRHFHRADWWRKMAKARMWARFSVCASSERSFDYSGCASEIISPRRVGTWLHRSSDGWSDAGSVEVEKCLARKMGLNFYVDLHIGVTPNILCVMDIKSPTRSSGD
jgi:hypothetical protein